MPDQQEVAAPAAPSAQDMLSSEIGASLASVWARYAGARPSSSEVDVDAGVVRWILPGGIEELQKGCDAGNEDRDPGQPERTMAGYRRETSAVVAKATRRRVSARLSKNDKKTGATTETFILEALTKKY
jgi:hypothetical protein